MPKEIVNTLREFIEREMTTRSMSTHEFADFVGVSQSTISRAMAFEDAPEPKLDFLAKLAVATGTDIGALVALVKPEASKIDPTARLLAERIEKLSPEDREFLDTFILGAALKRGK